MAVQFLIDSASDLTLAEAAAMGVTLLPLKVVFGDHAYADKVDMTPPEFYEKLIESDVLPTTCQIPPADFEAAYTRILASGDELVVICMSSKLSGTYQSAVIAAEEFPDRIHIVDSLSVCVGERILLEYGIRLAGQGMGARQICEALTAQAKKIRVLALLDTLEYLKKGGRISAATALAGSLLSIKPVIAVEDGEVVMAGKARGSKQGSNLLRQLIEKVGGVDFSKPYALAYSGLSDAMLQKYVADSADLWQSHTQQLPVSMVGCVIGTHVGPGAIALAFFQP